MTIELRELRAADADEVAAILSQNPQRRIDAEEVRSWLHHAAIDPEDLRVLVEDGRPVGYVDILVREDVVYADLAGSGREDALLDWVEARALEKGASKARASASEGQDELASLLERRGYARIRSGFEMTIELGDDPPQAPEWPDGVGLRAYRHPEDEQLAYDLQEEAFQDAWDWRPETLEEWRDYQVKARGFDPSLWFFASAGDEPAGVILAFPERVGEPDLGWISILGVRRPWRRRGVAEALLRHTFAALHARGVRRVGLGVDAESPTGATRLYERVGMSVRSRSDTWEKHLTAK